MKEAEIIESVLSELHRAESVHPNWPNDPIHAAAIVAEVSGELIRATLNQSYENGDPDEVKLEAIQTAAMAIRLLKNLPAS